MPARFCKNCIWGMASRSLENEGTECTNPELKNVQAGNVMPVNARACNHYRPVSANSKQI